MSPYSVQNRKGPARSEILAHTQILPPIPGFWQQIHCLRLCQTKPSDDSESIRAGFAVPKAQMTSFSPPHTYKHCVLPYHAPAVPIKVRPAPHALQLCFSPSQIHNWVDFAYREKTPSVISMVSSLMGSSWCYDTAGFDTLVVDEEGGSEGRQCSTVGLHLWKCWTKGQLLLLTPFTAY